PRAPRYLRSFPTRRSSDLHQRLPALHGVHLCRRVPDEHGTVAVQIGPALHPVVLVPPPDPVRAPHVLHELERARAHDVALVPVGDRKSTRLNSSHVSISYA